MPYLSFARLAGRGYTRAWWTNCRCRYRVFEGARNTKKSHVMLGLEPIDKILTCPYRNVLMLRQTLASNRNSTFAKLVSLIRSPDPTRPELTLQDKFSINSTNMTITYRPTGQKIIFDGLANPTKIKGTAFETGLLTDIYIDEAYEVEDEKAFRDVDGSLRGDLPKGAPPLQITLALNPWNANHWIHERFVRGRLDDDYQALESHDARVYVDEGYKGEFGRGLLLHQSTYKVNEFRTEEYTESMEALRLRAPEIYKVEALGMWGNATESAYPEWRTDMVVPYQRLLSTHAYVRFAVGVDAGLSAGGRSPRGDRARSATTAILSAMDATGQSFSALDEWYHSNEKSATDKLTPSQMAEGIVVKLRSWLQELDRLPGFYRGGSRLPVLVDYGDQGFREMIRMECVRQGISDKVDVQNCTKMRVQTRVDFERMMMGFGDLTYSDRCHELARETAVSRKGEGLECREDFDDHALNAFEYAWASFAPYIRRFKDFKPR